MKHTQHFKFNRPDETDAYDIEHEGQNWDRLDETLYTDELAFRRHNESRSNPHGVTAQQAGAIPTAEKGTPNGVASLGEDGKVPAGQLPEMDYIPTTEKGQASGVASLGSDGKVPTAQLPKMEVDAFTKNETLTAETAEKFGLPASAVPNEVFDILADNKFEIVSGKYTGNNEAERVIDLGFQPKAVFVAASGYDLDDSTYTRGGFATRGMPVLASQGQTAVEIVSNGFKVFYKPESSPVRSGPLTNQKLIIGSYHAFFNYIAFK